MLCAVLDACSNDSIDNDCPSSLINAVDLGLSVKWVSCNIGPTKPEAYGDYSSISFGYGRYWSSSFHDFSLRSYCLYFAYSG